jgi:hypothetical protein
MIVAALALAGIFISLYLTLYKLGVIGELSCTFGSCETVNTSRWAVFLGLPVAVDAESRALTVELPVGGRRLVDVVRALDAEGIATEDLVLRRPTLDEVFLALTGAVAA